MADTPEEVSTERPPPPPFDWNTALGLSSELHGDRSTLIALSMISEQLDFIAYRLIDKDDNDQD